MKLNLCYVFDDDKMHVAEISEYDSPEQLLSYMFDNGDIDEIVFSSYRLYSVNICDEHGVILIRIFGNNKLLVGKPGSWYSDDHIGGYYNNSGRLVVCEEYGLSDSDTDKYSVQVQNGEGYYDDLGKYHSLHIYED